MQPNYREGLTNQKQNTQAPDEQNPNKQFGNNNVGSYSLAQNSTNQPSNQRIYEPFKAGGTLEFSNQHRSKPMYSSTIQSSETKSGLSLESMGRFVEEHQKPGQPMNKPEINEQAKDKEHNFLFNKYADRDREQKKNPKMFASGFHMENSPNLQDNANDFNRFPAFNLKTNNNKTTETTTENKNTNVGKSEIVGESPEEKRRREILEIKRQLDEINKKMESKTKESSFQSNDIPVRPKNPGTAQSMIFPSSTSSNVQETFNINRVNSPTANTSNLSSLDKLYEQRKSQNQQQSPQEQI